MLRRAENFCPCQVVEGNRKLRVLDLGCGPGRDVKYFTDIGLEVTGLDGCKEFVEMCQKVVPESMMTRRAMLVLTV